MPKYKVRGEVINIAPNKVDAFLIAAKEYGDTPELMDDRPEKANFSVPYSSADIKQSLFPEEKKDVSIPQEKEPAPKQVSFTEKNNTYSRIPEKDYRAMPVGREYWRRVGEVEGKQPEPMITEVPVSENLKAEQDLKRDLYADRGIGYHAEEEEKLQEQYKEARAYNRKREKDLLEEAGVTLNELRKKRDELQQRLDNETPTAPGYSYDPNRYDRNMDREHIRIAKQRYDDAIESLDDALNKGDRTWIGNVLRGIRDANHSDAWTFGLKGMLDNRYISEAVKRFEAAGGDLSELSEGDQVLLQSLADESISQEDVENAGGGSIGHFMGEVSAESAPFIAEFIANPLSGAGKAVSKSLGKRLSKELLNKGLSKEAAEKIAKGATIAARPIADAAGAVGMAATSGAGRVFEGAERRMLGQAQVDENGIYAGQTDREDAGEAYLNSFLSTAIENHSEMLGEYFRPIGKAIFGNKAVRKALGADLMDAASQNDLYKGVKSFMRKARISDPFAEGTEEELGGLENYLLNTGEVTEEDLKDPAWHRDNYLGVLLVSGIGTGAGIYSYGKARRNVALGKPVDQETLQMMGEDALQQYAQRAKARRTASFEYLQQTAGEGVAADVASVSEHINSDNTVIAINYIMSEHPDLTEKEKKVIGDYLTSVLYAKAVESGMQSAARKDAYEAAEEVRSESNTDTGEYVRVALKDGTQGNIIAGSINDNSAVFQDDAGNRRQISVDDILPESVQSMPTEELAERAYNQTLSRGVQEAQTLSETPKTEDPQIGSIFVALDGKTYRIDQDLTAQGAGLMATLLDENGETNLQGKPIQITPEEYKAYKQQEAAAALLSSEQERIAAMPEEAPRENAEQTGITPASNPQNMQDFSGEPASPTAPTTPTSPTYPVDENGDPDFLQMQPEQAVSVIRELGEAAPDFIKANLADAERANKTAQRLKPKSTSFSAMKAELESIAAQKAEAERNLKYWQDVQSTYQEARNKTVVEQEQARNNVIDGRNLSNEEAKQLIDWMEQEAEVAIELELTPENWRNQFGEKGYVTTPIAEVKMGDNQYLKIAQQGRNGKLGMIKPTLEHPSVIIEDERPAENGNQERSSALIFVKTFKKEDGSRYYYFTSVTVSKGGHEVVISNQEKSAKRISKLLQQGKIAWINEKFSLHPTSQIGESVPFNETNKPTTTDNQPALLGINSSELNISSEAKDTAKPRSEENKYDKKAKNKDPEYRLSDDDMRPTSLVEVASTLFSGRNPIKLMWHDEENRKGLKSMSGYGKGERKKFPPYMFASRAKGGISVEEAGEILLENAAIDRIPFDESDAMVGVNAILDLFGTVGNQREINSFIRDNRTRQMEEAERMERDMIENDLAEQGYSSIEDYENDIEQGHETAKEAIAAMDEQRQIAETLVELMRKAGIEVSMDEKEMQEALMEGNVQMQARISALEKAARFIREGLKSGISNKSIEIKLPNTVKKQIQKVMGRDFDSHNIDINGIRHGLKNHGEKGKKLNKNSIPITQENAELIPYIMSAPDYIKKGSDDLTRESIRFYKTLSNGYVVVVEKEQKNSPNDMDTINIWAELSSNVADAYSEKNYPGATSDNVIISADDAAKIRKDAEEAIARDEYLQYLRTPNGEVYGFVKNGKIYLDPALLNPNTPIHEYTHLWDTAIREKNPELWNRGKELMKQTPLWEEVKNDPAYADIAEDEDLLASEVHARLTGKDGEKLLSEMEREADKSIVSKLREWLKEALQWVKDTLTPWTKEEAEKISLEDFARMPIRDLMQGKDIRTENTTNFANTYKTEDGTEIRYTSETKETYKVSETKNTTSDNRTGSTDVQRSGDTISDQQNNRLKSSRGEFCVVERVFTKNGYFSFTSGEKIENADDVAFIFSALEDSAKEHSFVVLVKNGEPTVVELGMGSFNSSAFDVPTIALAYQKIKPDEVYFVHNHPSGNLKCSSQDINALSRISEMFEVPAYGVIINLKTGKYGTFSTSGEAEERIKRTPENEYPLDVYTLDKQIFAPDYDPMNQPLVRSSEDVAKFINSHRMGDRAKISFIILSRAGRIVGNIHTPYKTVNTGNIDKIASYISQRVIQFGGENAILYGDFDISGSNSYIYRKLKRTLSRIGDTTLLDLVRVEGNYTTSANDEGILYEPNIEYRKEDQIVLNKATKAGSTENEYGVTPEAYEEMVSIRERAKEDGTFMKAPNGQPTQLNEKQWLQVRTKAFKEWFGDWELKHKTLNILSVPNHDFKGSAKEALEQAKQWAKEHIARLYSNSETNGKGDILISNESISKYLSKSATGKSDNLGVHLAALKKLPEIIRESIDAEQHKDRIKENGARSEKSNINPDVTIHRLYGAVEIDGKLYRVKTTLKEVLDKNTPAKPYSYEVTKIELLNDSMGNTEGTAQQLNRSNNSISAANLLQGVEKSYEKGKYLLDDHSKVIDENGEPLVIDDLFLKSDKDLNKIFNERLERAIKLSDRIKEAEAKTGFKFDQTGFGYTKEGREVSEDLFFSNDRTQDVFYGLHDGFTPQLTVAFRYGNVPDSGRSFNFRDQETEPGVSVVGRVADMNTTKSGYYDSFFGDEVYNVVIGWYSGHRGADGEMLLNWAEVLGETNDISTIAKSATDNNGDFSTENDDIRFRRSFGGNSGYVGYSMSKRAEQAREEGRFPKTDFKKEYAMPEKTLQVLTEAGIISNDEWHHTSKFGNRTTFYGWNSEEVSAEVSRLSAELGTPVRIIENVSEIEDPNPRRRIEKQQSKGWFDPKTGEIVIVLPNAESKEDAVATVLHEVVAHKGLPQMMGQEAFNDFLDKVYPIIPAEVKREIAKEYGFNLQKPSDRKALADEYIASIAESGISEPSVWQKIRRFLLDALAAVGIHIDTSLTDADIAYMLWKSRNNLQENATAHEQMQSTAKDRAMRKRLFGDEQVENPGIAVNDRFNRELQQQIDGTLKKGHVYQLGRPGEILISAGVPDLPIEMAASRLNHKSNQENHPFDLSEVKDLPNAIQNPMAVFRSATHIGSFVIMTEIEHKGKNFVVAIETNRRKGKIEINDIRSVHYRTSNAHMANWIKEGLLEYVDKEKMPVWLSKQRYNSAEVRKLYKHAAKIVDDFVNPTMPDENSIRYRKKTPKTYLSAADEYNSELKTTSFVANEAYVDYMASVKLLQNAIAKHTGKPIENWEDAYISENHLYSVSQQEQDKFEKEIWKPLKAEVKKITKELEKFGMTHEQAVEEVDAYLMAKHGIERNSLMGQRGVDRAQKALNTEIQRLNDELKTIDSIEANGSITSSQADLLRRQAQDKSDAEQITLQEKLDNAMKAQMEADFSGLFALMEIKGMAPKGKNESNADYKQRATNYAIQYTDQFESAHDTDALWNYIRQATDRTLRKSYESGVTSYKSYMTARNMYQYYVPLRGWSEETAEDVFDYVQHSNSNSFSPTIKEAKGRRSIAESPIATIGLMAQSAITQGNRNKMKQMFFNLARNRPDNGLLSIHSLIGKYNEQTDQYEAIFPDIPENATPDQIDQANEDYENLINSTNTNGKPMYVKLGNKLDIPYRIEKRYMNEHLVFLRINGEPVILQVNGNPRAAQAINGLLKPNDFQDGIGAWWNKLNRSYAAMMTSRNPAFIFSNAARDMQTAICKTIMEQNDWSADHTRRFISVWARSFKEVGQYIRTGKATGKYAGYIEEFFKYGGETGYTVMRDIKDFKKDLLRSTKSSKRHEVVNMFEKVFESYDRMNRTVENVSRAMAYITARKEGKTIQESIHSAKEITVNFNRKGAGAKSMRSDNTWFQNLIASSAGFAQNAYIFFDVGVQSLRNIVQGAWQHKLRALLLGSALFSMGLLQAYINVWIASFFGGDEDDNYFNLSEWERRNNFIIKAGDGVFVKIPVSIENRVMFGLGELAASVYNGEAIHENVPLKAMELVSSALPINYMQDHFLVPSLASPVVDIWKNTSWNGRKIAKLTDYNQYDPEFKRVYGSQSQVSVELSKAVNRILGGNDYTRANNSFVDYTNPAQIDYLVSQYFGGAGSTALEFISLPLIMFSEEKFNWSKDSPIINRFLTDKTDERNKYGQLKNKYFSFLDEYEKVKHDLKQTEKNATAHDFMKEYAKIMNSEEGKRAQVMEMYVKDLKKMQDEVNEYRDTEYYEELNKSYMQLMKQAVSEVEKAK